MTSGIVRSSREPQPSELLGDGGLQAPAALRPTGGAASGAASAVVSGVAVATGTLYAIGGPGRDAVTVVRQFGAFRVVGLGGLRTLAAGDVTVDG